MIFDFETLDLTMARRQTDTKIWSTQRWFKKLDPYHKLAWKYLTDVCDHAGIWKIDFGQLVDDIGVENFDLKAFINACNQDFDKENGCKISRDRIKMINKSTIWLTGFVRFQYENKEFLINPAVPAIKSALTILNGYGILQEALDKGYITLSKPFERTIDIDRNRDKDIRGLEEEKGGMGEKEEEKGKSDTWKQRPGTDEHCLVLPKLKENSVIELLRIANGKSPTREEVLGLWMVFKVQNFTGENYYQSPEKAFSHFVNWSKQQKINGTHQQQPNRSNPKTAGVDKLLGKIHENISARGSSDIGS